jgi:hypothetical protein
MFQKDVFDVVLAIHKDKNEIKLFALNRNGLVSINLDVFFMDHLA